VNEAVGEWGLAVEQAVVDRAVEEVEGDLEVGVGWNLAALDHTEEKRACCVGPGLNEVFAIKHGEFRVRLSFGDEAGDDASERLFV
jgi:hypothetical protein